MATVHLYRDGQEVTARTLVLRRNTNIESIESWWRASRRALKDKEVPMEFRKCEVDPAWIRYTCQDGAIVFIDRKRSML